MKINKYNLSNVCDNFFKNAQIKNTFIKNSSFISNEDFEFKKQEFQELLDTQVSSDPERWGSNLYQITSFFMTYKWEINDLIDNTRFISSIQDTFDWIAEYLEDKIKMLLPIINSINTNPYDRFNEGIFYSLYKEAIDVLFEEMNIKKLNDLYKYDWLFTNNISKFLIDIYQDASKNKIDLDDIDERIYFLEKISFKRRIIESCLSKQDSKYKAVDLFNIFTNKIKSMIPNQENDKFNDFDMYGMKIIIDDSVSTESIKKYIQYIDEAYNLLKNKKFTDVWYGKIFIKSEYGNIHGHAGYYYIEKDIIELLNKPSNHITYFIIHELGHRYWFKQMRPSQRAKFESLTNVQAKPKVQVKSKPYNIEAPKHRENSDYIEWEKNYDDSQDNNKTTPVSHYGFTNIDEAFAEAFAYYVLGKNMTRDQSDSFKSVLKTANIQSLLNNFGVK